MKFRYSIFASMFVLVIALLSVGCGSGGGSGGVIIIPPATTTTSTTSVSGTTGTSSSSSSSSSSMGAFVIQETSVTPTADTVATLVVDSDGDSKLTSNDAQYITPVLSDGSFAFSGVVVSADSKTLAELTVEKDGYAPVVKQLFLTKDTPMSLLAKIGDVPVFKEVTKLPAVADRENTYLKFGITNSSSGLQTFSKLMTLSELQAEADFGVDSLSESTIPVSAFGDDVKSVTAKFQAFDSTDEKDISFFPGAFSGHGRTVAEAATTSDTENALESAAFDMIELTDQNGNDIVLNISVAAGSKLSTLDAATCGGMYWVRRVNSAQAAIIEAWGDQDTGKAGFQVPIWSNDNSTSSWQFVGDADYNSTTSTFSICVDRSWQSYLNCDSEISIGTAPKQLCVSAVDQFGDNVSEISVVARSGNTYSNGYFNDGKATVSLTAYASTSSVVNDKWSFSYSGAVTGWDNMSIANNVIDSSTDGCDYDLNITVTNPYYAEIRVKVYSKDDNATPLTNKYVTLRNSTYGDYYYKTGYTGSTGVAIFKVKPGVDYTASYQGGTALANVNNVVLAPETADNANVVSVGVSEVNAPPSSYIRTPSRIKDTVEELSFRVSSGDYNGDTITMQSLTLNGTALTTSDYSVEYQRSVAGSYVMSGVLDLNSTNVSAITPSGLATGNYTMVVVFSDGKSTSTSSSSFTVAANNAPVVDSIYFRKSDTGYLRYFENSSFVAGSDYSVYVVAHDMDGDSITRKVFIDGVEVSDMANVTLSDGDHNISATVTEDSTTEQLSSSRDMHIFVGNIAPVLGSVSAMPNRVDIAKNETFKLSASANDAETATLTVIATDENGTIYPFIKSPYGPIYETNPITLTTVKAQNNFVIVASDGDKNSTSKTVSVESYKGNLAPIFTKQLVGKTVEVNTQQTFECEAEDPEGTDVTYSWKVDNVDVSETSTTLVQTFTTTGAHYVSCTATDSDLTDPKSATTSATILVTNPAVAGTLTVHTGYEGIKVTRHDTETLALLEEKETDANGDVTFSVTGDRTTFAVMSWSGMSMDKNLLMELIQAEMLSDAHMACDVNNSVVTECSSADWCAMGDSDVIEDWVWQLSADNDEDQQTPDASTVDTNSNGQVDVGELYTALLASIDANHDGKISFAEMEIEGRNVAVEAFVNIPVREYYIGFTPISDQDAYESDIYYGCNEQQMEDFNLTIHYSGKDINGTKTGYASGSGYGWMNSQPNANGDVNMSVVSYSYDNEGTLSYLVKQKDSADTKYLYYLLGGKTEAQMQAGVTLEASDFQAADKNVTLLDTNGSQFSIYGDYKGLKLYIVDNYLASGQSAMFYTNPDFTYTYSGFDSSIPYINKSHMYYYGDSALSSSYDINNYPFLDVDITVNDDGLWGVSGSDISKVSSTMYNYTTYVYDNNTSQNSKLEVSVFWTITPTSMPNVNILDMLPSDVKDDVSYIMNLSTGYNERVALTEVKGLDETQYIDMVAGSPAAEDSRYGSMLDKGYRQTNYNRYVDANQPTRAIRKAPMFTIEYDVSHIFSK